jgi:putative ABC transport system permease protein
LRAKGSVEDGPRSQPSALEEARSRVTSPAGPLWRKAPGLLLRYPELLVSLAASAFILALAASSGTLFLASAGTAALADRAADVSTGLGGLTVLQYQTIPGQTLRASVEARDDQLSAEVRGLDGLRPRILTLLGPEPIMAAEGGDGDEVSRGRLVARTGAFEHVTKVGGTGGSGVWIAASSAARLGLEPGDEVRLADGDDSESVSVAAVYRDLADRPVGDYWQPLAAEIYSGGGDDAPPAFILADEDLFYELDAALADDRPLTRWEFPLDRTGLTLSAASNLAGELQRIETRLDNIPDNPELSAFSFPDHFTVLPDVVENAQATLDGIATPVRVLSAAAVLVALVMIAATGMYSVRRRRVEAALLSARGMGTVALGVKAGLEALAPVVIGCGLGWLVAIPLVQRLGPHSLLLPQARGEALERVAVAGLGALVVLAVVSALSGRREAERTGARLPGAVKRLPWEVVLLVLAGAAYYTLANRGINPADSGDDPAHVDVFLVLFPLLLIAGGAGLAARAFGALLPRLRTVGRNWPPAMWLAARRLTSASNLALTLVAASALSVGILCYAGTLVASVDASATAKAQVATGSDFAGVLQTGTEVPPDLPFPHTELIRVDQVSVEPAGLQASLLIIDPETFARAAFWDDDFSDRSLDELISLMGDVEPDRGLPVVITGQDPGGGELQLQIFSTTVPLDVKAEVAAWPRMGVNKPTLISTPGSVAEVLRSVGGSLAGTTQTHEILARGDADHIERVLAQRDVALTFTNSAEQARTTPALLASSWTFSFLLAIGVGAGLVVLSGLLLYLQARQRAGVVSFALAGRMGLGEGTYRRSVIIELLVMLAGALATGVVLALGAISLVYRDFDVLPELPPEPLFRLPVVLLGATAALLIVAAVIGGWRTHRTARKANVAEVLRLAG